jgi:hypothetical protein
MEAKTNFKKNFVNIFGAFGYFFSSMQWIWAVMLNFSLIKLLVLFISPNIDNTVTKPSSVVDLGSSPLFMIIAGTITIAMIVLTVYVLVKMPSIVVKTSKKVVRETADNVAPIVLRAQHKKDTKKNLIKLTPRIILLLKILLIIIPFLLTFTVQSMENQMIDYLTAAYVSLWLACISGAFFAFQYTLAKLFVINRQDIR